MPLQPVLPWEMLVDQMAESESYMESMAMHSCMGKLFVERQEEVIAALKSISDALAGKMACCF